MKLRFYNFILLLGLLLTSLVIFTKDASAQYTITWPVPDTTITSPFGYRDPPLKADGTYGSACHKGCDVRAPIGTPLKAGISGVVTANYGSASAGNYITLDSTDGAVRIRYLHLDSIGPASGTTVNAGDIIGATGNTGGVAPHLHYELYLRAPSGQMVAVDPVAAQGKDLSDPQVVADLIENGLYLTDPSNQARGQTSVGGALVGTGTGSYGAGYSIGPSTGGASEGDMSCSSEILSTGQQLSEARMNLEAQQVNEAITPPGSVAQMGCLDQFGELFNSQIGNIFGDGLEIFNFGGIFTDTQNALNNSINNAISNNLLGGRGANITQSISTTITDAFNSMLGNPSSGSFTCEAMNILWEIMQCEGILDFKIPSLQELIGGGIGSGLGDMLEGLKPDSCAGEALYNSAITAADRTFSSFLEASPVLSSTVRNSASSY